MSGRQLWLSSEQSLLKDLILFAQHNIHLYYCVRANLAFYQKHFTWNEIFTSSIFTPSDSNIFPVPFPLYFVVWSTCNLV